jgi:hypothetical protein
MEGDFKVTVMKTPSIGGTENIPKYATYEEAVADLSTTNKTMGSNNITFVAHKICFRKYD